MTKAQTRYELPEEMLQAVVGLLNELPAGRVRGLLNALELECHGQDLARQEAATAQQRREWLAEHASANPAS